jgi:hypothetical protein
MGSRYKGLISYMKRAEEEGTSPTDAIRMLVKDRYFGSYEKSPYRRAFVEEKYPELLEVYDKTENMILLLKDR